MADKIIGIGVAIGGEGAMLGCLHVWTTMLRYGKSGASKWGVPTILLGLVTIQSLILVLIELHQGVGQTQALAEIGFSSFAYDIETAFRLVYILFTMGFISKKPLWPQEEEEAQELNQSDVLVARRKTPTRPAWKTTAGKRASRTTRTGKRLNAVA